MRVQAVIVRGVVGERLEALIGLAALPVTAIGTVLILMAEGGGPWEVRVGETCVKILRLGEARVGKVLLGKALIGKIGVGEVLIEARLGEARVPGRGVGEARVGEVLIAVGLAGKALRVIITGCG